MLDTILLTLALGLALGAAPLFWWLAERNALPNGVRYSGALFSIAALHFSAGCRIPSARGLFVCAALHLVAATVFLLVSLAPQETRAVVQLLFFKSRR